MAKPYKQEKKAYKKAKRKLVLPWKLLTIVALILTLVMTPLTFVLGKRLWQQSKETPAHYADHGVRILERWNTQ